MKLKSLINNKDWKNFLDGILKQDFVSTLEDFLDEEYKNFKIFPPKDEIFNAFNHFSPKETKVVILGQDPYHGSGEANGLAFSVNEGIKIPPSLRNIFVELMEDVDFKPTYHGDLTAWAKQGVLLLNSTLTVFENEANSHHGRGWEQVTDEVLHQLSNEGENIVFILWGKSAQAKKSLIDEDKHLIIESPHPSPLSAHRGFFGSKPFSKGNEYLKNHGKEEIDWQI